MADDRETIKNFQQAVNMSPQQRSSWLETEDSHLVGQKTAETNQADIILGRGS